MKCDLLPCQLSFVFRLSCFFGLSILLMNSIEIDASDQKTTAAAHGPLQVRTNKHRCFVFCFGHTSLTCVPGIGKKNKSLLHQSGVHDLVALYDKYRSIDNKEKFSQWLESDIGFTAYQAKMTTCGLCSKLGKVKETNTGLAPIVCSSKIKRRERLLSLGVSHPEHKQDVRSKADNGVKKPKLKKKRGEPVAPSPPDELLEKSLVLKKLSEEATDTSIGSDETV